MITKIQSNIATPRKTVFERPDLKPMPRHILERLTPDFHYFSLATPVDEIRAKLNLAPVIVKTWADLMSKDSEGDNDVGTAA